jgi:hypothetical protein
MDQVRGKSHILLHVVAFGAEILSLGTWFLPEPMNRTGPGTPRSRALQALYHVSGAVHVAI